MAATYKNKGYEPEEIQLLKEEIQNEGKPYVQVEDEEVDMLESGECVHIQFVGNENGQEVICDAIIYTLRLHHSSLVYEMAVEKAKKSFPQYVAPEDRKPNYKINPELDEEIELYVTELIEELEETEAVQVQEHLEIDRDFEYGIGLDVSLNVDEITDEVILKFIDDYNNQTVQLDNTLYSFKSEEED